MSEFEDRLRSAWADDDDGPGPEVQQAVMAEFDRSVRGRRRSRWALGAAAVAASVIVAWSGARAPQMESDPVPEQVFTALPYVVQPALYERTEVRRVTVPVAELIAAGLPMQADPGAHVEADVMVGQDGRARAVRLISVSE
jgi:hypothetical protein